MCGPQVFFLTINNDVCVNSFTHFKGLKGFMTQCGNKVFIS